MINKISRYFIMFIVLLNFLLITNTQSVFALAGPLDNLNVTMTGEEDERYSLKGEFTGNVEDDEALNSESFANSLFDNIRKILFGGFGIATLTLVAVGIVNLVKLGQAADNPHERSQAIKTLLHTGIAVALLGGITLIIGLSMTILK